MTRDGLADLDVCLQVSLDITTQWQSRLANVLAGTASQQGESGEGCGVGYVFHAKLLCTIFHGYPNYGGNALPWKGGGILWPRSRAAQAPMSVL
uniref:Uncharacterized protein n=1 Tax=Ectopseudomonas oleovorans TaxID=301 RepID=A0A653AZT2_ECTOL